MFLRSLLILPLLAVPAVAEDVFAAARTFEMRGDPEGAIAALERRLIAHPGDQAAQLRLGQLYEKISSAAVARIYYTRLATSDGASASMKRTALERLRIIDGGRP